MANNPELGKRIGELLKKRGIETPMTDIAARMGKAAQFNGLQNMASDLVDLVGLDARDDSISGTPDRLAKMYQNEIFYGMDYDNFPACTTVENKMGYDEMVAVEKIDVLSVCEHHFVPFMGYAHIAYIPATKVLGLSKFNRVVDFFSRRPQIQERLTEQVCAALQDILETDDVGVVIQAQHLCVKLRGVKQHSSTTTTSKMEGKFRSVAALRSEFLALIKD